MRNKYKIYSVILTGIILTGCKSVRMTSQDRQQFMPNGISIAQQLLEETGEATQAKSSESIKTTPSANNTTSESSVEESSMKESKQSQDKQENNVNILALEIEPYELSDVCNAIFEKSLDEVEQSQNQYSMYYLTDGDKRVRKYDMLGLEYEVKGVSGSYPPRISIIGVSSHTPFSPPGTSTPRPSSHSRITPEAFTSRVSYVHYNLCNGFDIELIKVQNDVSGHSLQNIKMNMMILR